MFAREYACMRLSANECHKIQRPSATSRKMKNNLRPFHLAFPVSNLDAARMFYKNVLGCEEGRSDATWVDLNFFGQVCTIHNKEKIKDTRTS